MNFQPLETEGGKLVVILFMLCFLIGACIVMALTGHPLQPDGKELAVGAVSSLLTLLYQYLNRKA
jgi:hypothetical protein